MEVSRSSVYAPARQEHSEEDELLMKQIDKLHLEHPSYGSRNLVCALQDQGIAIGRDRVRRLMQTMDVHAIYPQPRTSQPGKEHKIYPYLLRHLPIDRPTQVWATDSSGQVFQDSSP